MKNSLGYRLSGVCVSVIAAVLLVSCVVYSSGGVPGGSLARDIFYFAGSFFMRNVLGVGTYVLAVLLVAVGLRHCFGKRPALLGQILLSLCLAFLFSSMLSLLPAASSENQDCLGRLDHPNCPGRLERPDCPDYPNCSDCLERPERNISGPEHLSPHLITASSERSGGFLSTSVSQMLVRQTGVTAAFCLLQTFFLLFFCLLCHSFFSAGASAGRISSSGSEKDCVRNPKPGKDGNPGLTRERERKADKKRNSDKPGDNDRSKNKGKDADRERKRGDNAQDSRESAAARGTGTGALTEAPNYVLPQVSLLEKYSDRIYKPSTAEIESRKKIIRDKLLEFGLQLNKIEAIAGPTVTLFKLFPAEKVKVKSVTNHYEDLKIALHTISMNMDLMADSISLEVPNERRSIVPLHELVESQEFRGSTADLPLAIGYSIDMKPRVIDLAKAPHLLVAGTTGGGKSVSMHSIIVSLLLSKHPSEVKMVLIDPKRGTEFGCYRGLVNHYLALLPYAGSEEEERKRAIVVDRETAEKTLRSLRKEMEDRYILFDMAGVSKISEYNSRFSARKLLPTHGHRFLPYIVVVIDEFGELISKSPIREDSVTGMKISSTLIALSALGRACGIHLVIATQTPKAEVITTQIKNNFPWQIALMCNDAVQSRVMIDSPGAEQLIGNGDMLLRTDKRKERVQGAFVDKSDIRRIVEAVAAQKGRQNCPPVPFYLPEVEDADDSGKGSDNLDKTKIDSRFEEVARYVVICQGGASVSDLQAQMGLGFPRARKIMSQMEAAGIVGPQNGSRPREVLVSSIEELEEILKRLRS